jgi:hypothetical protein
LLSKLKKALTAMLLAAFGLGTCLMTGPTQSRSDAAQKDDKDSTAKSAAGLGPAEFAELKPILDVKNQPWTNIPWKYSLTEARQLVLAFASMTSITRFGRGCLVWTASGPARRKPLPWQAASFQAN